MTILFRYLTKEVLLYFSIVLAAVLGIYVVVDFIEKVDNFLEAGVPVGRCVIFLLYKFPFIFVQIGPLGFLLAILASFGLMRKNNEIIALKSCGVGNRRLLKPVFAFGLFLSCVMFIFAEWVVPVSMVKANQIWLQEVRKKNIYASRTNDIWMRAPQKIIHISRYIPEEKRLSGITIYTFDDSFRLVERVDAASGEYIDAHWKLNEAVIQVFSKDSDGHQLKLADSVVVDIELNPDDLSQAAKRTDEMGIAELGRYIRKVEREGYGAARYRVDYHSKIAAPFICILLSMLGSGIAFRGKHHDGLATSILAGLAVAFLYWIFNGFCISLGYAEMMLPMVAAWTATFVFSGIAVFMLLSAD
jgi:lipopolysaccharide export system permease protein